jgi:hypothetical protein
MPVDHIVELLIAERQKLDAAITALGGGTAAKKLGRPRKDASPADAPDWVQPNAKPERKKHSRKFSLAQRKQQGERMRAYWAAKKKAQPKSQPKTGRKRANAA